MTTEPPPPPESAGPQPASQPSSVTSTSLGGLSGEMLLMISGVLILGVYVLFGLIADEWYPTFLSVVAATFAVILPRVTGSVGSGISSRALLKVTGYVIAVAGLWDFIFSLRFGWGGFVDVVGWLILGAAAVLGFLGARAIKE
jgi:hypothetical protein